MQVKVWNDNIHPYKEKFREVLREIPAGGYIEMDEDEAEYFLAAFTPPKKDGQGRFDPIYFKKLRIDSADRAALREREAALVCHANGQKAEDKSELASILSGFGHMLAERDVGGEESETLKKLNKDLKRENTKLKSRLDIIEEKLGLRETEPHAESV